MGKGKLGLVLCLSTIILNFTVVSTLQASETRTWDKVKATEWLDKRAKTWLEFPYAQKSVMEDQRKGACVACHTTSNYTITRPQLQPSGGSANIVLDNIRRRIIAGKGADPWDPEPAGLPSESYGSESIMNVYTLALTDEVKGLKEPSAITVSAFERLWQHQRIDGGWDTFNFHYEPYASLEAQTVMAAQAAIALGRAPGYLKLVENDSKIQDHIKRLRNYLIANRNPENLWAETWLLQASLHLDGLLSAEDKNNIIKKLIAKQNKNGDEKGSWALYTLNKWKYSEAQPPKEPRKLAPGAKGPDGLSTGLITYTLIRSGMKPTEKPVADALDWLSHNQNPDGSWTTLSINKVRDPSEPAYYFESDEATVWSVRALMASEGSPY